MKEQDRLHHPQAEEEGPGAGSNGFTETVGNDERDTEERLAFVARGTKRRPTPLWATLTKWQSLEIFHSYYTVQLTEHKWVIEGLEYACMVPTLLAG